MKKNKRRRSKVDAKKMIKENWHSHQCISRKFTSRSQCKRENLYRRGKYQPNDEENNNKLIYVTMFYF